MKSKIAQAIAILSKIDAKDLDDASILDLTQLQYWLMKHQGSIFVKTVGRIAAVMEKGE
jgi:hypothetical protein